jgi:hypothetical protein
MTGKRSGVFAAAAAVLTMTAVACSRHESMTGAYGEHVVAGTVAMASTVANSSPAGVRVSIAGSGNAAVLSADGRFLFSDAPDNAELRFTRLSDGIAASMVVPSGITNLVVELDRGSAHSGRSRAVAPVQPYLQFEGILRSAGASSVVVTDARSKADVTVAVNATTIIRRGDTTVTAADLLAGDRVHVKATSAGNVYTAVELLVQGGGGADDPPGDDHGNDPGNGNQGGPVMTANGTVVAVGAGQLTVASQPNGNVVVKVDGSTTIKKQGQSISLGDIKAGDAVNAKGTRVDDHTLLASQIEVRGDGNGHH